MYTGNEGIYTYTFAHQKKPECHVCGGEAIKIKRLAESTLQDLIDYLIERQDLFVPCRPSFLSPTLSPSSFIYSQIRRPSFAFGTKNLYLQAPPQLEATTRPNLEKTLGELFTSGDTLTVTDAGLPFSLNLEVSFGAE